jgi:hypothetical protein
MKVGYMTSVPEFSLVNLEVFESHLVLQKIMLSSTFKVINAFATTEYLSKLPIVAIHKILTVLLSDSCKPSALNNGSDVYH